MIILLRKLASCNCSDKKMINENLRIWQKTLLVAEGERRKKRSEKRSEMFAATSAVSLEGFYSAKNLSSWIFFKFCKNVRCHLWCWPEEPRGERDKKTEKVRRDKNLLNWSIWLESIVNQSIFLQQHGFNGTQMRVILNQIVNITGQLSVVILAHNWNVNSELLPQLLTASA